MRRFISGLSFVLLFVVGQLLVLEPGLAQQKQAKKAKATAKATQSKASAAKAAPRVDGALAVVPDNVLGFAVIRNLAELDEKVGGLAQALNIPAPPALMTLRQLSGVQEGLDDKGAILLAFVSSANGSGPPLPVVFVPVSDYGKFIGQLQPADAKAAQTSITIAGQQLSVTKKGNYAAVTAADNEIPGASDRLKEIVAGKSGSLGLANTLTGWMGEHDAYLVVMPEAIKRGIGPARQGLQEAKRAFADNEQLKQVGAILDIYDNMLSTIENEVTHFAVGVRIQEGAVFVDSHSVFLPNGSLAQAAKDAKRPAESGLAALPAGPYMMAFDGVFPESWAKGMMKFSAQAMQMMATGGEQPLSHEDVRKLTETMQKSMAGVNSMAMRVGPLAPGKSMYDSMSGVIKVANARQYLVDYEQGMAEMGKLFEKLKSPLFKSYEASKSNVDGVATLQLTMDMSGMLENVTIPQQRQMMELIMGKGGKVTAYLAPADANTVVLAYSQEALRETMKSAKKQGDSLAQQQDVAKTLQLLPKDAQWVVFISPKGVVDFGMTLALSMAPGAPGQLPPFPETSPVGFGARMTGQGFETSLVVPTDVLQGIGGYVQRIQQNFGPGAQPGVNGVPQPPFRK